MPNNSFPPPSALEIARAEADVHGDVVYGFAVAQAKGDHDGMTAQMLEAHALDQANQGGPRLMDDIRTLRAGAA